MPRLRGYENTGLHRYVLPAAAAMGLGFGALLLVINDNKGPEPQEHWWGNPPKAEQHYTGR